jgi:DNA repair protein RecO (recombination protein O)
MPLRESEAIVLRSYPMGEADRLVSFLSRTAGRLRGVASGARRPKSRFGSTLELLSHIRVWYFEREMRELVRISQCELIDSFLGAQRDYAAGLALALMSEVTEVILPEREASDPVFRLILTCAKALTEGGDPQVVVAYFSLWMVRLSGWLPSLETCQRCGKAFSSAGASQSWSGELRCTACAGSDPSIKASSLQWAGKMLKQSLKVTLEKSGTAVEAKEISRFALDVIERQAERKLSSRKLLEGTR